MVSKAFEKHVNNRIVDHLVKCGLFSDFHYGFRSSRSSADLLTVVSDRIVRAFNSSGATQAAAFDIYSRHSVPWGINPPLSCQTSPLNWQTVEAPFLGNPPFYCEPSPKSQIFQ